MDKNKNWINNYFSQHELGEIRIALDEVEKRTSGEIILSLRNKRKWLEKLYSPHELAWKDFNRLGVGNTKERTGIMVFIIFEERYYDIIADEGIYKKIPDGLWNEAESDLKEEFRKENYSAGLLKLVEKMSDILCREFPCSAVNDDELDDEVIIN